MPPSPHRKTPHRDQSPRQAHRRLSAFHPVPSRADPHTPLAISFSAKVPPPSARAMLRALPQTRTRFRRPGLRSARPLHSKTAAPVPPAFRLLKPATAHRSAHRPACFPAPAREKNSPVARKSRPPFPALFSAQARRSRFPAASLRSAPLRASPFHTLDASAFVQSPSS